MKRTVGVEPTTYRLDRFAVSILELVPYRGNDPRTYALSRRRSTTELIGQIDGAGNEVRTRDIYLGKVVLYQLSYSRIFLLI